MPQGIRVVELEAARAYSAALSAAHHSDFGWAAQGAALVLLRELRSKGVRDGLVVDLGSGSGILAKRLTTAGYDVLGVDVSAPMVRIARKETPLARFVTGSAFDFEPPACVAVTAIGEVLGYEFDNRASLATLGRVFKRVHDALVPGGVFLFDLSGPGRGGPTKTFDRIFESDSYSMLIRVRENASGTRLTRDHILFTRRGDTFRRIQDRHVLRLFDPAKVTEKLRSTGFSVRKVPGYPGGPSLAGWTVFLARKKGRV